MGFMGGHWWDSRLTEQQPRFHQARQNYETQSKHTLFLLPTQKRGDKIPTGRHVWHSSRNRHFSQCDINILTDYEQRHPCPSLSSSWRSSKKHNDYSNNVTGVIQVSTNYKAKVITMPGISPLASVCNSKPWHLGNMMHISAFQSAL